MSAEPTKLLRIAEVARLAGCSTRTIYRHIETGGLRPTFIGLHRIRISVDEWNRWLGERTAA